MIFIEADKAWCPFPQGARSFFQINTLLLVIVFHLLFATITLSSRLGYPACLQAPEGNRLRLQPNLFLHPLIKVKTLNARL